MVVEPQDWNIQHLRQHLQFAVDLELWTIPFYMSAMYSIVDRSSTAFQLIQSVVNQEMLHVQCAANLANAWGLSPSFTAPRYVGQSIPHLDFALDTPDPRPEFSPYSAEIGPLDPLRINAMALIEYPEYDTGHIPNLQEDATQYGSIGEFYDAVAYGAQLLADQLHGGVNQITHFAASYRKAPTVSVTSSGAEGWYQAAMLIDLIRSQGEGSNTPGEPIAPAFRNTADDSDPARSHYDKFIEIRAATLPTIYATKLPEAYTEHDRALLRILQADFMGLRATLEAMFAGRNPEHFLPLMIKVGADISNCWQHGVTPNFDPLID